MLIMYVITDITETTDLNTSHVNVNPNINNMEQDLT